LSLINNIESLTGLFLIYATTPDFFTDPKHGIVVYGALAGRIGKPEQREPRSLDTIWNMDAIETTVADYNTAAIKIRNIYCAAYPDEAAKLPTEAEIRDNVAEMFRLHPSLSAVRFWRVLVTAIVASCDDRLEGESRPVAKLYDDVMDRLREE
jgi:hypothetical protein